MSTDIDKQIAEARTEAGIARQAVATKDAILATQAAASTKAPWWSAQDAMTISASVLMFGAFLITATTVAILKGIPAATVLRVYGMLTIIVMAVFLVVAGYDAQQMGPVIGLLGTLAGYLVGRSASSAADNAPAVRTPH
jgi:hypothetical protein